jgi:hypothetical protein
MASEPKTHLIENEFLRVRLMLTGGKSSDLHIVLATLYDTRRCLDVVDNPFYIIEDIQPD